MTILNFVTQDELDNLDEDPRMAFLGLVNHAQRKLSQQIESLDLENEHDWRQKEEICRRFMNVIVAAGRRFEVEPFLSMEVPRHTDFRDSDYKQFESDLDHYVTQLVIDNSMRSKKTSVEILPDSKDRIRSYVHGLRKCVEDAHMQAAKRKALLSKLDDFEKELEKRRLGILAVTLLSFEILAIPGSTWASIELAHKLITNISQVVAESKQAEDQTRQVGSPAPPKALSPPRPTGNPGLAGDLDDETPF